MHKGRTHYFQPLPDVRSRRTYVRSAYSYPLRISSLIPLKGSSVIPMVPHLSLRGSTAVQQRRSPAIPPF